MRRILHHVTLFVIAASSVACGKDRSARAVSQVEFQSVRQGETRNITIKYDYDGEELDWVKLIENGQPDTVYDFSYDSGLLRELRMPGENGDRTIIEFDYEDDHLSEVTQTRQGQKTGGSDFEYDGDDRLENSLSSYGDGSTERGYEYDDDGRLDRINVVSRGVGEDGERYVYESRSEFHWNDDATLERVESSEGDDTARMSYDDEGRLDEIEQSSGTRYTISYDDDGLIDKVHRTSQDVSTTWRISYEDHDMAGFTFHAPIRYGEHFDLSGKAFEVPDPLSLSLTIED